MTKNANNVIATGELDTMRKQTTTRYTRIAMKAVSSSDNKTVTFFLKLQYNIDQELITIIRLTTISNVQLAVKIK